MTEDENRILNLIRIAFRDVRLGAGVGLRQGNGLDDYADARTLERCCAQDQKTDWSAIPVEDLGRYSIALAFFDAEGMRFHLPAYLCADLHGALKTTDIIFTLVYFEHLGVARFEKLNAAQRSAVREFLLLHLNDEFSHAMIERALREFWSVQAIP